MNLVMWYRGENLKKEIVTCTCDSKSLPACGMTSTESTVLLS